MIILGIHDGHNASACLMRNGEILAALQEERIQYQKNYSGFPEAAIRWVFSYSKLSIGDVDCFAFNGDHMPIAAPDRESLLDEFRRASSWLVKGKRLVKKLGGDATFTDIRKTQRLASLERAGGDTSKAKFVNHHLCHAASTYYGWGNYSDDILVLTCDGMGDRVCATVSKGTGGHLKLIESIPESDSVCNIYAALTFLLGMVPLEHEYKIMGMAPYVSKDKSREVADMFWRHFQFVESNPIVWQRVNGMPPTFYSLSFLKKMLDGIRFDYVMGGLQLFFEEIMTQWVRNCVLATGINRVALGGGGFMNVKANKLIMELDEVADLFVYPSCGDETNAMGACYYIQAERKDHTDIEPLKHVYFGPEFSNAEVLSAIDDFAFNDTQVEVVEESNIDQRVAKLLSENKVVARFNGREEFGARALGARSILANPSDVDVKQEINEMIKNRDFWMPFASSIIEERASDYIVNPKNIPSPYMILSYDTTDRATDLVAGIHPYDKTIRSQLVSPETNPGYYNLIKEFEEITGIGGVLNTSFNLHGFPIVHTPENALDVFQKSNLQYLAIGDYLVKKNSRP